MKKTILLLLLVYVCLCGTSVYADNFDLEIKNKLIQLNIVDENGFSNPDAITREECLVSIMRVIGVPDEEVEKLNGADLITLADTALIADDAVWFQLRGICESIGASVVWMEDTGNIKIEHKGKSYICEVLAPNDYFPEKKYFYMKNDKNGQYVYLWQMGFGCAYIMQDGRYYLSENSMNRLLKEFGYSIDKPNDGVYCIDKLGEHIH